MRSNTLDVFVKHPLEFDEDHRLLLVVVGGQQRPTQPSDCVLGSTHGALTASRDTVARQQSSEAIEALSLRSIM